MRKIVLICTGGLSTGLLLNKIKKKAKELGEEFDISAHGVNEVDECCKEADVILVGPQVRYALDQIKTKFPEKPIGEIDMHTYGRMKGDVVLETAISLLQAEENE